MLETLKWNQLISDISNEQKEVCPLGFNITQNIFILWILLCIYDIKVFVPSHNSVWLLYNKTTEIKWKIISQFIILIAPHVSVSFEHHQVYIIKKNKYTKFVLNYVMKIDPFSTS
jgi:hypothetical protein